MDRKHAGYLKALVALVAIGAIAALVDPTALFAAPVVFATVASDSDDDTGGGDPPDDDDSGEGDDPDADDPDSDPDDDEDDDDPDGRRVSGEGGKGGKQPRMIPAYRLEQQQRQFQQRLESAIAAESQKTQGLLNALRSALGSNGTPEGTPRLTPQQDKLRKQFLELFPEFSELLKVAPKTKDLLGLAERAPEWDRDTEQYWGQVARSTSTRLFTHAAAQLGVRKLDEETRDIVRDAFISWVKADRTQERNHRYEGQDETLIGDFWTFFSGRFRTAGARPAAADALRRAASMQRVPRGGGSSTHIPAAPRKRPKPSEDPFEDVNSRAWAALQDEQAASR